MLDESDFDLTWAYLLKCKEEKYRTYGYLLIHKPIPNEVLRFKLVLNGITRALDKARKSLALAHPLSCVFYVIFPKKMPLLR